MEILASFYCLGRKTSGKRAEVFSPETDPQALSLQVPKNQPSSLKVFNAFFFTVDYYFPHNSCSSLKANLFLIVDHFNCFFWGGAGRGHKQMFYHTLEIILRVLSLNPIGAFHFLSIQWVKNH